MPKIGGFPGSVFSRRLYGGFNGFSSELFSRLIHVLPSLFRTKKPLAIVAFVLVCFSLLMSNPAQARNLRVGIYENSPKVFVDDKGNPQGIFVDVVNEIARRESWTVDYIFTTWSDNLRRLENREIDVLVDMSYSPERAEKFVLTSAFVLESWLDVYTRKENRIRTIRQLNQKRIVVLAGSVQEQYMQKEIKKNFNIDFKLLPFPDYPSSVHAVKSGLADVMVASRFFYFSPSRDPDIIPMNLIFRVENLYFAFPKGTDPDLVSTFDSNIAAMKNDPDSVYYKSLRRWSYLGPHTHLPAIIKWTLAIMTTLSIVIGLFAFLLRQEVRRKTAALRESHELLEETQAVSHMGGWEYDVDTRRVKWTKEVYRIHGVDQNFDASDVARNIAFYSSEAAPILEKAFHRAVDAGVSYDLELELVRADGKHIWVRTTGKPVMKNGRVTRVTGNIMDITESRRAEEERQKLQNQLASSQKMELVGRLAGGVAHDLNNMLTVILGYAEQALKTLRPSQGAYSDLKEIHDAAERSMGVTRQLLAFARKQTIIPKVLDLNETVGGMLNMFRRLLSENIELVWSPGEGLSPVRMDPAQIDQLLANLIVNARDAITAPGKIIVETRSATFDDGYCAEHPEALPGEYVMLAVSDTGAGMDKATLERIFEPFFTTKELGKGTGLGLATVHGIVKQNGGFVSVYSEPGKGTTFKIYLPQHAILRVEKPREGVEEVPRGRGETILLVEDESSILKLTWKILSGLGYNVLTAGSPSEAMRRAEGYAGTIDLLLTDVVLPEMNGRVLADKLMLSHPAMKCLFMSGYTSDVISHHEILDEGIQFLQKPFSNRDLANKVRVLLEK